MIRVLKPGGSLIISSLHPVMVTIGFHAEFKDKENNYGFIENTPHWTSEFVDIFNKSNLKIVQCIEPKIQQGNIKTLDGIPGVDTLTLSSALVDLPVAVIWRLEKVK